MDFDMFLAEMLPIK